VEQVEIGKKGFFLKKFYKITIRGRALETLEDIGDASKLVPSKMRSFKLKLGVKLGKFVTN
jgi:hypothetical protein